MLVVEFWDVCTNYVDYHLEINQCCSTTTTNTAEIQNFIYFYGLCYDEPCNIFFLKFFLFCKLADLCVHQMQGEKKKLWNFSSGQRVKLSNK